MSGSSHKRPAPDSLDDRLEEFRAKAQAQVVENAPRDALRFPSAQQAQIEPYLPPLNLPSWDSRSAAPAPKPFVTLTYATSLDASLSLAPGVQTALSGPESKAMTHYLRSKHGAILVGCGTAIADDPSLNCRIAGVGGYGKYGLDGQPRPVIIDPKCRWVRECMQASKVVKLAREGKGRGPWVFTMDPVTQDEQWFFEPGDHGGDDIGRIMKIAESPNSSSPNSRIDWQDVLGKLASYSTKSVMIEGGGKVLNEWLSPKYIDLVDSVIITIAPTWLGKGGVQVCPDEKTNEEGLKVPVGRLVDVVWLPLGEDVVLCGRPKRE